MDVFFELLAEDEGEQIVLKFQAEQQGEKIDPMRDYVLAIKKWQENNGRK